MRGFCDAQNHDLRPGRQRQEHAGCLAGQSACRAGKGADSGYSAKEKELIAVGIAVAIRCSYCLANHVAKARQMGASRKEI